MATTLPCGPAQGLPMSPNAASSEAADDPWRGSSLPNAISLKREDVKRMVDKDTASSEWSELPQRGSVYISGQTASVFAHDLNNYVDIALNVLSAIRARLNHAHATELHGLVDIAHRALSRAGNLAHRLLTLARPVRFAPTAVDFNAVVLSMADLLVSIVPPPIEVRIQLSELPVLTLCEADQLESALLNLIVNARDAMQDGGRITIETWHAESPAKRDSHKERRMICLCVSDTGSGMSGEVIQSAFDPFFTTKAHGQRTGLGLPMVKAFAEQSEGYVEIRSAEGVGTSVAIYLPEC